MTETKEQKDQSPVWTRNGGSEVRIDGEDGGYVAISQYPNYNGCIAVTESDGYTIVRGEHLVEALEHLGYLDSYKKPSKKKGGK